MARSLRVEVPDELFAVGEPIRDAHGELSEFPDIDPVPELRDWCKSNGVKPHLYTEDWIMIDWPGVVWLDVPSEDVELLFFGYPPDQIIDFLAAFFIGIRNYGHRNQQCLRMILAQAFKAHESASETLP